MTMQYDKNSKLAVWCLMLVLVCVAGEAGAEPGQVSRWLMGEPATLMDLGMARLEQAFDGQSVRVSPRYDREADEIVILVVGPLLATPSVSRSRAEEVLQDRIHLVKSTFSMIDLFFRHVGYQPTSQPDDLAEVLSEMVVIVAREVVDSKPGIGRGDDYGVLEARSRLAQEQIELTYERLE